MAQIRVHKRFNGWKLGDYDVFRFHGLIFMGQLSRIADNGWGQFFGFCIIGPDNKLGHAHEWDRYLHLSKPDTKINPRFINAYEEILAKDDPYH